MSEIAKLLTVDGSTRYGSNTQESLCRSAEKCKVMRRDIEDSYGYTEEGEKHDKTTV
ncbi:hypothetical protein [Blautia faecicola]|jgi:hypothetical protein|uniref:hypothetical protein n=1 Tax=Blautia faecicola TaxID=2509240 RepID=UPI0013E94F68|nr:hypothetical protein [Blautia faecicola]